MYKSPCLLIDKIKDGSAAPSDWMALIITNKIPSTGPDMISVLANCIP